MLVQDAAHLCRLGFRISRHQRPEDDGKNQKINAMRYKKRRQTEAIDHGQANPREDGEGNSEKRSPQCQHHILQMKRGELRNKRRGRYNDGKM